MNELCSDCHYIGELIKPRTHNYKFPVAGFLLGLSAHFLIFIIVNELTTNELSIIMIFFLVCLIPGAYLLYSDLKSNKIQSNNPRKTSSLIYIIFGVLLSLLGFISLFSTITTSNFSELPVPLIWFTFGLVTILYYLRDSICCPNCDKLKTMIPLDTPKAQELIKEHNLSIPTQPE